MALMDAKPIAGVPFYNATVPKFDDEPAPTEKPATPLPTEPARAEEEAGLEPYWHLLGYTARPWFWPW
jgi:hypothetical protein